MKRNVDLTENMLFSQKSISSDGLALFLKGASNDLYPWVKSGITEHKIYSVIDTGNREDRKEAQWNRIYNSNTCDCCGEPLTEYLWDKMFGICKRCNEQYEDKNDWRFGRR